METFGKRLESLIKHSSYKSVRGFAKHVGVSSVAMSRIINEHSNPSYDVIVKCLELFPETDVHWLLMGVNKSSRLEFENRQLKERVSFFEKREAALKKHSSNRTNPQLTLDLMPKILEHAV